MIVMTVEWRFEIKKERPGGALEDQVNLEENEMEMAGGGSERSMCG